MLKKFRCYQLAVKFYKQCELIRCQRHLKDQLLRASLAVPLNLAEGSERVTDRDRRRFYRISMSSLRECQAILDLVPVTQEVEAARCLADELGGGIFKLCKSIQPPAGRAIPQTEAGS